MKNFHVSGHIENAVVLTWLMKYISVFRGYIF